MCAEDEAQLEYTIDQFCSFKKFADKPEDHPDMVGWSTQIELKTKAKQED